MRYRSLLILLLSLLSLGAWAHPIRCVGGAHQVVRGADTLFFFTDEIHLHCDIPVDWYRADGSMYQSHTTDVYPDDGSYYIVWGGRKVYAHAYALPSWQLGDISLSLGEVDCDRTELMVSGTIPAYTIETDSGVQPLSPLCYFSYTDLSWSEGEVAWTDSLAVTDTMALHTGVYSLPAICKATDIWLVYGVDGRQWDSVSVSLTDPVAIRIHPTSTTTMRGEDKPGPGSNEEERPSDNTRLTGSAPLDILFELHPTPAVQYYRWRIYQGSTLIVDRSDETTRYTFSEPGSYRVVGSANNAQCVADSTEFAITVSNSFIRVPNVFTPNGDGVNDEFRVDYRSIKEFDCWVYNRWGKLVYHWSNPAKGWDGNIGGRPAAEGAYFYVIRAKGTDAAQGASYTSKISYRKHQLNDDTMVGIYQLSGDINLIRGKK